MYKYYICPLLKKIAELEFVKDSVKGNYFKVREITYDSIKKAVKEMTSTENFFKLLPPQENKTYIATSENAEKSCDMLYEEEAAFSGEHTFHILCLLAETIYKNPTLGMYMVANRVLENYSRQQLHNSITADITNRKVYPLTGNYHFDKTGDSYKLEVDFSDCTLRSYKNDELIRVRHDYSTLYDLIEFISSISEEEIIERYLRFDKEHPQSFYPDRFYVTDETWTRIEQIYYNPDADSGSQYVVNVFYGADILEALKETTSAYNFFAFLEENCKQYLYDVGDDNYEEFRNKYENEQPSFEGESFNSMLILCRLALIEEFCHNDSIVCSKYHNGIETYALYKIAEQFLKGYYKDEFPDDGEEKAKAISPLSVGEKLSVASSTTDIHEVELESEGILDFGNYCIITKIAGHPVIRKRYANLKGFVENIQALEFSDLVNLGDNEEEYFFKNYSSLFESDRKGLDL